jgi:hypothetical protein
VKRNAGILSDAAARANAAASARRRERATLEERTDSGMDAGRDAEKTDAGKEDAAREEERPDADEARADTWAASASIPPSLNISAPPVGFRIASAGPQRPGRHPEEAEVHVSCWKD